MNEVRDSDDAPMAAYSWLADGTKAGVVNGSGDFGLEYLGSLVYTRNATGELALESAAFGGGRIEVADTGDAPTGSRLIADSWMSALIQ